MQNKYRDLIQRKIRLLEKDIDFTKKWYEKAREEKKSGVFSMDPKF